YHSGASYVYWGSGARVSSAFYFSTFYWPQRQIVVINHHHRPNYYYRHRDIVRHEERRHWRHDPKHRHGVVYHQGYQPTREIRGQGYPQADVAERRRWAVEQRERNNVSLPEDRRIREQYPEQQRDVVLQPQDATPDIDRDRLRLHRDSHAIPEQRTRELTVSEDIPVERPASQRQINIDAGDSQSNGRESSGQVDGTLPVQERPIYSAPERVERNAQVESNEQGVIEVTDPVSRQRPVYEMPTVQRQERPVYDVPEPIERQVEPITELPRPIERQERPVYEAPRPIERQEQPIYEAPRPIERQERPVYEAPRPIERQEQPIYEAPRPIERQEQPVYEAPRPIERQEQPVFEAPRPIEGT
ncbi:MAG: hypothetical protein ACK4NN_14115, partial [Rheinheimera sp.]